MAIDSGFQVMSCQTERKPHQYSPMFWKAVNPFLQRIKDEKEKEDFLLELHYQVQRSLHEFTTAWTDLLIVHIKK